MLWCSLASPPDLSYSNFLHAHLGFLVQVSSREKKKKSESSRQKLWNFLRPNYTVLLLIDWSSKLLRLAYIQDREGKKKKKKKINLNISVQE